MNIREEKGGGLILVIVVMAVLMILATSFLFLTTSEGKLTARYHYKIQAYHYAMSGIEFAFEVLNDNFLNGSLEEGFPEESFPVYFNGSLETGLEVGQLNTSEISVEILADETGLLIKSTGRMGDLDEMLSVRIPKIIGDEGGGSGGERPNIPPNQGVIITNDISLKGSAKIIGNATLGGSVHTTGAATITGGITVGTNLNFPMPTYPPYPEELPSPLNVPPVSNGNLVVGQYPHQQYTINGDGEYNKLQIVSNGTLKIDVGEGTRILRVKQLDIQQGHILLQGSGRLILYLENSFNLNGTINNMGNSNNLLGDPQQLTLFYGGNTLLELNGSDVFVGDLFCKTANIKITGGSSMLGNAVVGGSTVDIQGGTDVKMPLLYAPNAHVEVIGGSRVEGVVVAKSLEGAGNGRIIGNDTEVLFPESIWGNTNGGSGDSFGSPVWGN
ncbi:hypothetical protein [Alkaliphilus hydrothermalis]|uniref:Type 4 fimbrial biogenesis protein PilX N-terminal domain-containing protein n=1 Tax=Alkaliphilus hydrothermalis TaxID=1482730 RepID=A0ABS2NMB9_9FIRM|nr:hypothetical protein [Alkaliphilus hydrothermalis]MBM7613982.1 hypothetical protein [Alkaliphilus hydrothermalis]